METVNEDERALALNEVQILKVCLLTISPLLYGSYDMVFNMMKGSAIDEAGHCRSVVKIVTVRKLEIITYSHTV